MIKFFRQIRQNLLMENPSSAKASAGTKTSKPASRSGRYLKYAIGEIVLVVIGILIALSINNWNESRKSDLQEQSALNNIHRDFIKNKELLTEVKNSTQLIINSGLQILNHTGTKSKPATEIILNDWLNKIYNSTPYYPQNGFLDDLLSSGKLGIFKNTELRNLLSSWKPEVEILGEMFHSLDISEDLLNTYILENGSWLNADQVSVETRNVSFPKSGFTVDNRDLLDALLFENLVENLVIAADNYYSVQKKTEKRLDEIIALLENEIKKSK
jgi:type II secretory pathway pseudopilin PulG